MRPLPWRPPIDPSPAEQSILRLITWAKLFVFLHQHRHELADCCWTNGVRVARRAKGVVESVAPMGRPGARFRVAGPQQRAIYWCRVASVGSGFPPIDDNQGLCYQATVPVTAT